MRKEVRIQPTPVVLPAAPRSDFVSCAVTSAAMLYAHALPLLLARMLLLNHACLRTTALASCRCLQRCLLLLTPPCSCCCLTAQELLHTLNVQLLRRPRAADAHLCVDLFTGGDDCQACCSASGHLQHNAQPAHKSHLALPKWLRCRLMTAQRQHQSTQRMRTQQPICCSWLVVVVLRQLAAEVSHCCAADVWR